MWLAEEPLRSTSSIHSIMDFKWVGFLEEDEAEARRINKARRIKLNCFECLFGRYKHIQRNLSCLFLLLCLLNLYQSIIAGFVSHSQIDFFTIPTERWPLDNHNYPVYSVGCLRKLRTIRVPLPRWQKPMFRRRNVEKATVIIHKMVNESAIRHLFVGISKGGLSPW